MCVYIYIYIYRERERELSILHSATDSTTVWPVRHLHSKSRNFQ